MNEPNSVERTNERIRVARVPERSSEEHTLRVDMQVELGRVHSSLQYACYPFRETTRERICELLDRASRLDAPKQPIPEVEV